MNSQQQHNRSIPCEHCGQNPCVWVQYLDRYNASIEDGSLLRAFGEDTEGPVENETMRYVSYRAFIRVMHGILGDDNRVENPPCVVNNIRSRFPSNDGHYTGFRP